MKKFKFFKHSDESSEQGSISIAVAILAVSLLAAAALVLDGGRRLGTYTENRDLADNAARAGAQAIFEEGLRGCGWALIEPADAVRFVDAYLAKVEPDLFANPSVVLPATESIDRLNISACSQALVLGQRGFLASRSTDRADWTIVIRCSTVSVEIARNVSSGTFGNTRKVRAYEAATTNIGTGGPPC